jgi:transglutaminase-like putative cysteine protease
MTFERAFRFYSYLLLLAGFLTLVSSGAVSLPVTALFLLGVALSVRTRAFYLSTPVQLLLIALMLAGFTLDIVLLSGPVDALVHLLLLISLVKVFSVRTGRDYMLLYLISLVFVVLASAFTISIFFLVALAAFVYLAIVTFMLFESRDAYEQNRQVVFSQGAYLKMSLAVATLVMLFAWPIFAVIPRGGFPLVRAGSGGFLQMTGFSSEVSLGEMGRILTDNRVAMRVRVDQDPSALSPDVKWRGVALDRFEGKVWRNTRRMEVRVFQNQEYGRFLIPQVRRQTPQLLEQTIVMEPFSNVVFAAPDVVMITDFGNGRGFIVQDGNNAFNFFPVHFRRLTYTVYSDVTPRGQRLANPVGEVTPPPDVLEGYLQLPPIRPEIARLARQVTRNARTPYDKAEAIERFLKASYKYDLENVSASAPDPLYDFLFNRRSGHCEYFATAQAVMMRSVGIPCRLVNGFRRGEYNTWGGHFVVRQSDAHSWVEGFFPDVGWIEFDATPSDLTPPPFLLVRLGDQWLDALDSFWTEVISFDHIGQVSLFQSAGKRLFDIFQSTEGVRNEVKKLRRAYRLWIRHARLSDFVVPLVFVIAALVLLGVWARYRRYLRLVFLRNVLGGSPERQAPEYYREMLAIMKRRGFVRKLSETPLEFATRTGRELGNLTPVRLTEMYYGNRFGNLPLAKAQLTEIYLGLRTLRRLRSRRIRRSQPA